MSEEGTYETDNIEHEIIYEERRNKKIKFQDNKIIITGEVQKHTCLWDKKDHLYRNRAKRSEAWIKIANKLNISVTEAKKLWKKARDTQRYFTQIKTKRKSQKELLKRKNSVESVQIESFEKIKIEKQESQDDLSFLDENSANLCQTLTNICDVSIDSQNEISQFSSNPPYNERIEKTCEKLKHTHIWFQLEKLFEQLEEDKITDLNFKFFSLTYDAILETRKKKQQIINFKDEIV